MAGGECTVSASLHSDLLIKVPGYAIGIAAVLDSASVQELITKKSRRSSGRILAVARKTERVNYVCRRKAARFSSSLFAHSISDNG